MMGMCVQVYYTVVNGYRQCMYVYSIYGEIGYGQMLCARHLYKQHLNI